MWLHFLHLGFNFTNPFAKSEHEPTRQECGTTSFTKQKLSLTLPVNTIRSYNQLLRFMLYFVQQSDQHKSTGQFQKHFTLAFLYKSASCSFLQLHFGFVIFWHDEIGAKVACKIMMKLTPGVNFTKVFCELFLYKRPFLQLCLGFGTNFFLQKTRA